MYLLSHSIDWWQSRWGLEIDLFVKLFLNYKFVDIHSAVFRLTWSTWTRSRGTMSSPWELTSQSSISGTEVDLSEFYHQVERSTSQTTIGTEVDHFRVLPSGTYVVLSELYLKYRSRPDLVEMTSLKCLNRSSNTLCRPPLYFSAEWDILQVPATKENTSHIFIIILIVFFF